MGGGPGREDRPRAQSDRQPDPVALQGAGAVLRAACRVIMDVGHAALAGPPGKTRGCYYYLFTSRPLRIATNVLQSLQRGGTGCNSTSRRNMVPCCRNGGQGEIQADAGFETSKGAFGRPSYVRPRIGRTS